MKNAILYLTTPLLTDEENQIPDSCYKLKGDLIETLPCGVRFQVHSFGSEQNWSDEISKRELLIPHHKIDFIDSGIGS